MSGLQSLNEAFARGECPQEILSLFQPGETQDTTIDWERAYYNAFVRSYDIASRFSCRYDHILGFDKVMDAIVEKHQNTTLLGDEPIVPFRATQ
jgi:hypothetical protein